MAVTRYYSSGSSNKTSINMCIEEMLRHCSCIVVAIFMLAAMHISYAVALDSATDSQHCIRAINFYEKRYSLPRNMLYSIATVESGKWNAKYKMLLPWPWVLNVEGKPYYFDKQSEAAAFLKRLIQQGIENIDIGCTQINWKYHGKHRFKKPEHVLNPVFNVAYAAYFLAQNYLETRNWHKAIAMYHSRTDEVGKVYLHKVKSVWNGCNKGGINIGGRKIKGELVSIPKVSRINHKIIVLDKGANEGVTGSRYQKKGISSNMIVFSKN